MAARAVRGAEREGFEPSVEVTPYSGLANLRLQPLGHRSRFVVLSPAGERGARKLTVLVAACKRHRAPPAHTATIPDRSRTARGPPADRPHPCAISRPPPHWPPVPVPAKRAVQAIATEVLTALTCFVGGLVLVFGVPGVADLVRGATEALFGRPALPPDKARLALSLALTPTTMKRYVLLRR